MGRIFITWKKSAIGYHRSQKDTIKKLGLKRLNQTVEHDDSPAIRGMITKVAHLIEIQGGDGS
jgi:large subunit ribosomal protein L30|tara:strand:+ start:4268 stop:4456 length:189 start_codon:yes stop_codon:yes gene_type:complete